MARTSNVFARVEPEIKEQAEEIIDQAISKSIYYHECLEELGGVTFSKENIKPGYIVQIHRYGKCEVISTGKVNITYKILEGGASGFTLKAAYAEIEKIISTEISEEIKHPFKVGDKYTVEKWNGERYEPKEYVVTKVTRDKVTLKSGKERAINRKPRNYRGNEWALGICDGRNGTIYKSA